MDELYRRRVLDGDTAAFSYFITQYKDMAFSIARSVLRDEYAAEEVVQDAFLKAFRGLGSFQGQSKFSTWFYRIVTNEALQRLRRAQRNLVDYAAEYTIDVPDETEDPAELQLADDERHVLVNQALDLLPPKEALALRLFYLDDESIRTVSDITGWTESNVRVILHRARKNMRARVLELSKNHHYNGNTAS